MKRKLNNMNDDELTRRVAEEVMGLDWKEILNENELEVIKNEDTPSWTIYHKDKEIAIYGLLYANEYGINWIETDRIRSSTLLAYSEEEMLSKLKDIYNEYHKLNFSPLTNLAHLQMVEDEMIKRKYPILLGWSPRTKLWSVTIHVDLMSESGIREEDKSKARALLLAALEAVSGGEK